MADAANRGRWPPSRVLPLVAEPPPPTLVRQALSHSSLSRRGVPPIHQACQRWHPVPARARRLGTSWPGCIPDPHREQPTDTLMDSFIRPFIPRGGGGRHGKAMLLPSRPTEGMDRLPEDRIIFWTVSH